MTGVWSLRTVSALTNMGSRVPPAAFQLAHRAKSSTDMWAVPAGPMTSGLSAERCRGGTLDWGYGGHVLPLAPGVWRSQERSVKRLKDLETENTRLRRAIADLTLD